MSISELDDLAAKSLMEVLIYLYIYIYTFLIFIKCRLDDKEGLTDKQMAKAKEKEKRRQQREMKRRLKKLQNKEDLEKDDEKMSKKIAMEERKLLIAQRKLESIRLLDALFDRIKVCF